MLSTAAHSATAAAILSIQGMAKTPTTVKVPDSLGHRIQQCRKQCGMSQLELAQKIGTIQPVVSTYETDRSAPPPETLAKIAKALGTSSDQLLGLARTVPQKPLDKRILRRLDQISALSRRDQSALLRTLDAFTGRGRKAKVSA